VGTYRLVEVNAGASGGGLSTTLVVPAVEEVAVVGRVISGRAKGGYFVLEADRAGAKPELLGTREAWERALGGGGVSGAVRLEPPDALAGRVPGRVLRPWRYRVMGGKLGLPDDTWSLAVQVAGLVTAFFMGLVGGRRRWSVSAAVVLGLGVNVVAQIIIAGGGPGAFVGFVFLPVLFVVAARLGRGVRWVVARRGGREEAVAR
jgi:hypothetical protein